MKRTLRLGRPEEGWLVTVLVVAMGLILAYAIDDPSWVQGQGALTDGLPLCAMLGCLVGFAGPKLGWGRWTTHIVGALFAALLIPILAAWALHPGASIPDAFHAAADGSIDAYLDIAWRGRRFTTEEVHYILVLGGLVWGTMQFASYAVFGHRRPLGAILVVGLVLLANMALTSKDQLQFLVLFTVAALFLLVAMHVVDERETWTRRHIGDPGAMSELYLRGGTVFVLVAMVASLGLTAKASSSPLAGAWGSIDRQLIGVGEAIQRLFPVGGDVRGTGSVTFGGGARISGRWFSNDDVAFTAVVPAGTPSGLKWRAGTYDAFQLDGWAQTDTVKSPFQPGDPILDGIAESSPADLVTPVSIRVQPASYHEGIVLSPGLPLSVDVPTERLTAGINGWLAGVEVAGGSSYGVEADALRLQDQDAVTGNRLRVAGTDYPVDVTLRYTEVPAGAMGPDSSALLSAIKASAKGTDPYSLAVAMVAYLRDDSRFTYSTDIRDGACDSTSAVECFARTRTGYCLHYASTMAILLRAAYPGNPIPTRLVQGFLPGKRVGSTETVTNRGAHAWVEVYFPGYGWIPFDPTGGGVGQPNEIKDGPPVASPSPTPSGARASGSASPSRRPGPSEGADSSASAGPNGTNGPVDRVLAILFGLLLAVIVGGLGLAAWIRGPRGELSPDAAWRTLSRVGSRLGFAPRPTETVYEYANSLGELVPVARADLDIVAEAKVETAYAGVTLGYDRLAAVREATRRLRVALLLRLAFRRRLRKRR